VSYLVDTNILVRLVLPHDPLSPITLAAIDELQTRGEALLVTPQNLMQNLMEFWAGGHTTAGGKRSGLHERQSARRSPPIGGAVSCYRSASGDVSALAPARQMHAVRGRQAFDAHLAAVMMESGLDRILTFNVDDCRRYAGITAVSPQSVLAPPAAAP
jgi:predicted nucleic acid-binding protein